MLLVCFLGANALAAPAPKVYVVPVEEMIDPGLASFIERSIGEAEEEQADLILLEIDTPGGMVDSAMEIRKSIDRTKTPVVALVKGGAISAGAYITLACPKIAMVPGSTIGDAEPN